MNKHGAHRYARAIIDLAAIRHNYALLKQKSANKKLIAVVKADAYGHGAVAVARALPHADAFAVATVAEAVALRQADIKQKILVLGGVIQASELQICIEQQLDPVIHQPVHLDYLKNIKDLHGLQIWVKIDSGMGRLGYQPGQITDVLEQLGQLPTLGQIRLMTHLASADNITSKFSAQQLAVIKSCALQDYEWGIANSAGILGWPDTYQTWVRAGIAMYGANPMSDRKQTVIELQPAMRMTTRILAVNFHKKGDFIGYGNTYQCPQDMTIAVIAAGYADGYPRLKIQTAQIKINHQLCDIVGRVSMDMITVDVSTVSNPRVGDEVILFGDEPDANDVADCSGTIAYEIFCNVGAHVRREYLQ